MKPLSYRLSCLLSILLLLPAAGEAAAVRYSATNLTAQLALNQENFHFGQTLGLNNRGDILIRDVAFNQQTGHPDVTSVSVAHSDGNSTSMPTPYQNGFISEVSLNNRGEVAALVFPVKANIDLSTREIWVYSASGVATRIEGLTGAENIGFNDRGQITASNTDEDRAFRYTPGVGWENLGSLATDGYATPRAINNAGAVVGGTSRGGSLDITPFLYRDGTGMEDIPAPFGLGRAINDNFVVTGDGGFIWYANEMRMDYVFNNQAFGFIRPQDINNAGAIIGMSPGSAAFEQIGFYWDEQNGLQGFGALLDDPTWTINDALAINDEGWILARGHYGNDRINDPYAYLLLRPVPEPGAAALLILAGVGMLSWRKRPTQVQWLYKCGMWRAMAAGVLALMAVPDRATAATIRITVEGTVDMFYWYEGFAGPENPVPPGTPWLLTGVYDDQAAPLPTHGIGLLGELYFGESLYLGFDAAQMSYDTGRETGEDDWGISVEDETPDNPREINPLAGFLFDEFSLSVEPPWWGRGYGHAPPVGTMLPAGFPPGRDLGFGLTLRTMDNQYAWLGGTATSMSVVIVPEPGAGLLLSLVGLGALVYRRRARQPFTASHRSPAPGRCGQCRGYPAQLAMARRREAVAPRLS